MSYVPPQQIQIRHTGDAANNGVKCLVYGLAGAGKTYLMSTVPRPLILSAEGGLLSIKKMNLPYIEISNLAMLAAAYHYVANDPNSRQYWTICLDSVSEIAEQILASELKNSRDPRKAYGEMAAQTMQLLRDFRNLPQRHVVFSAKQGRFTDQGSGMTLWGPLMPGQQLDQQLPYMFDEVLQLVVGRDSNGIPFRALRTERDNQNEAKDRSGLLDPWEQPNLSVIFDKIMKG